MRTSACKLIALLAWEDLDRPDAPPRSSVSEAVPALLRATADHTSCGAALECLATLTQLSTGKRAMQAHRAIDLLLQPAIVSLGMAQLGTWGTGALLAELCLAPPATRRGQKLVNLGDVEKIGRLQRAQAGSAAVTSLCLRCVVVVCSELRAQPASLQSVWDACAWSVISRAGRAHRAARQHVIDALLTFAASGVPLRVPLGGFSAAVAPAVGAPGPAPLLLREFGSFTATSDMHVAGRLWRMVL